MGRRVWTTSRDMWDHEENGANANILAVPTDFIGYMNFIYEKILKEIKKPNAIPNF